MRNKLSLFLIEFIPFISIVSYKGEISYKARDNLETARDSYVTIVSEMYHLLASSIFCILHEYIHFSTNLLNIEKD